MAQSSARIALFLPILDDGGAERVMLQLGDSFRARKHEVDLVLAVRGGALDSQIPSSLRVVDLGAKRTVASLPALVRYLRRVRPQALLSTLEHSNIMAVWGARLSRTPVRVVLREANVLLPRRELQSARSKLERGLMLGFYRSADALIAVSESVAESMARELHLPRDRVRTIYNPVITQALYEKAAAPVDDLWFAEGAPPVVLGVGRLVRQKDFGTLIRAFAKVRAARPARLCILGEGEQREELSALAHTLGVSGDVRLLGYDHNPFRYMQRASVFALSSIYEGLPGALIQAMACGCHVISTDCPGGSREVLQGGQVGPLVPMSDPDALARGILELLERAERAPGRVRHNVDRFSEHAAVDAYLDALGVGGA